MTKQRLAIYSLVLLALPSMALAESVFRVTVQKQGEEMDSGLSVLVSDGLVVTTERLVRKADQVLVESADTGARIVASVEASDEAVDLALLAVPSLQGESVAVASEESAEGRHVYLRVLAGVRREGVFHAKLEPGDGPVRYRITSLSEPDEVGAPLMNNCGELLGIGWGMPSTDSETNAPGFGLSGALADLASFLAKAEVDYQSAAGACPSLADQLVQAEESKKRSEAERTALSEEIEAIQQQLEETERQRQAGLEQAEAEAVKLRNSLGQKNRELETIEASLVDIEDLRTQLGEAVRLHAEEKARSDAERAENQSQERFRLYLIGGLGAALAVACGLLVWRSKRHRGKLVVKEEALRQRDEEIERISSELEASNPVFTDLLLLGEGPNGQQIRVKVNGNALARVEAGQVLGRSSLNADYVISEESVSRRHALLRVAGNELTVEDMGSYNGTFVDGVRLETGQACPVRDGAEIALGDVDLVVRFVRE